MNKKQWKHQKIEKGLSALLEIGDLWCKACTKEGLNHLDEARLNDLEFRIKMAILAAGKYNFVEGPLKDGLDKIKEIKDTL